MDIKQNLDKGLKNILSKTINNGQSIYDDFIKEFRKVFNEYIDGNCEIFSIDVYNELLDQLDGIKYGIILQLALKICDISFIEYTQRPNKYINRVENIIKTPMFEKVVNYDCVNGEIFFNYINLQTDCHENIELTKKYNTFFVAPKILNMLFNNFNDKLEKLKTLDKNPYVYYFGDELELFNDLNKISNWNENDENIIIKNKIIELLKIVPQINDDKFDFFAIPIKLIKEKTTDININLNIDLTQYEAYPNICMYADIIDTCDAYFTNYICSTEKYIDYLHKLRNFYNKWILTKWFNDEYFQRSCDKSLGLRQFRKNSNIFIGYDENNKENNMFFTKYSDYQNLFVSVYGMYGTYCKRSYMAHITGVRFRDKELMHDIEQTYPKNLYSLDQGTYLCCHISFILLEMNKRTEQKEFMKKIIGSMSSYLNN